MTKPCAHSTDLQTQVKREKWAEDSRGVELRVANDLCCGHPMVQFCMLATSRIAATCWAAPAFVGNSALLVAVSALAGCATASSTSADARAVDAARDDGNPGAVDAPIVDAAMPIDAAVDAACVPVWSNILGNGDFENAVLPWVQTPILVRTAAQKPFAPYAGTYAALFGVSNNGNGTLTQSVVIPAAAQGLRMRGFNCFVTEDLSADADRMVVTLENAGGTVVESLLNVTNSNVAATCAWAPFTYLATSAHAGETLTLRLRGTTNATLLTRFAFDELVVETLACP